MLLGVNFAVLFNSSKMTAQLKLTFHQRRSVGGAVGYICPRAPRNRGAKMGVQKFHNKGKNRSQARLLRRQTSSDSSRLVRTVGEGGAKRQWRSKGASGGTRPGAHHLGAYQEVLFILFFRRIHTDYKNCFVDYCIVMYAVHKGFKSRLPTTNLAPKGRTKQ